MGVSASIDCSGSPTRRTVFGADVCETAWYCFKYASDIGKLYCHRLKHLLRHLLNSNIPFSS
jgi:hypothetical protein